MRKTRAHVDAEVLAVDLNGLMAMLSCGAPTARAIAKSAGARIPTGSRRSLYSVEKIKKYLDETISSQKG